MIICWWQLAGLHLELSHFLGILYPEELCMEGSSPTESGGPALWVPGPFLSLVTSKATETLAEELRGGLCLQISHCKLTWTTGKCTGARGCVLHLPKRFVPIVYWGFFKYQDPIPRVSTGVRRSMWHLHHTHMSWTETCFTKQETCEVSGKILFWKKSGKKWEIPSRKVSSFFIHLFLLHT